MLERGIADGEHFVDKQHVRFRVNRHGECQPHLHTAGVRTQRAIDEFTKLCKFNNALKALGDKGETDLACRIAAEAWSAIRQTWPGEAEKLNGALHYLTRLNR